MGNGEWRILEPEYEEGPQKDGLGHFFCLYCKSLEHGTRYCRPLQLHRERSRYLQAVTRSHNTPFVEWRGVIMSIEHMYDDHFMFFLRDYGKEVRFFYFNSGTTDPYRFPRDNGRDLLIDVYPDDQQPPLTRRSDFYVSRIRYIPRGLFGQRVLGQRYCK